MRYTIAQGLNGVRGVRSNLKIDGRNARPHNTPHQRIERREITEHVKLITTYHDGASYS
jgi:hypothetical protein